MIQFEDKCVYPLIYKVRHGGMNSINCYLYQANGLLTLVDAGIDTPEFHSFFDEQLAKYKLTIQHIDQIILTHHHNDHIGVVNRILQQKLVPIFAHHQALERLYLTEDYQLKKRTFFTQLYSEYGVMEHAGDRLDKMEKTFRKATELKIKGVITPLAANDTIGDLQVIEAPGHSPDSILLYDKQAGWLFVGDLVLAIGTANALVDHDDAGIMLPTVMQYRTSLEKIRTLKVSYVFAGHEQTYTNLQEVIDQNVQRIDWKRRRFVEQVQAGHTDALALARAIYGERATTQFMFVMSEIIGYSLYAERCGDLRRMMHNGQWRMTVL